jgi:hypothetical protein
MDYGAAKPDIQEVSARYDELRNVVAQFKLVR